MCVADEINASSIAGNCGMHVKAVELSRHDYNRTLILHARFTTVII